MFGYFKMNGMEWNGMKWRGTEWNGVEFPFGCLGILRRNGANSLFHCLENRRNGIRYNFFISFLPLLKNTIIYRIIYNL